MRIASAISASAAPPRKSPRTSVSSSENKQLRSLPSAVRRIRLQLMQNGRLTEAMKPTEPASVGVLVIEGGRAWILNGRGHQRPDSLGEQLDDVGREQDLFSFPEVARIERHVLDEPQLEPVPPGEPGQRDDLFLGLASHGDGIDLDGIEPGFLGRQDPFDHLFEAGPSRQPFEFGRVQRVQADVDPFQSRVPQRPRRRAPAGCRWSSGRCREGPARRPVFRPA